MIRWGHADPEIRDRHCPTCMVGWRSRDRWCWACGREGRAGSVHTAKARRAAAR